MTLNKNKKSKITELAQVIQSTLLLGQNILIGGLKKIYINIYIFTIMT